MQTRPPIYTKSYAHHLGEFNQRLDQVHDDKKAFAIPSIVSPAYCLKFFNKLDKAYRGSLMPTVASTEPTSELTSEQTLQSESKKTNDIKKIIFDFSQFVDEKLADELKQFQKLTHKIKNQFSRDPFHFHESWLIKRINNRVQVPLDEQKLGEDYHLTTYQSIYQKLNILNLLYLFRILDSAKIKSQKTKYNDRMKTGPLDEAKRKLIIQSTILFSQLLNDIENDINSGNLTHLKASYEEIDLLTKTISNAINVVRHPDKAGNREALQANADMMRGKPCKWKLVAGAVVCLVGAVMMALSFAGIVHSGGLSISGMYISKNIIGAGYGLLSASGYALFSLGRRGSVSKPACAIVDAAQALDKFKFAIS